MRGIWKEQRGMRRRQGYKGRNKKQVREGKGGNEGIRECGKNKGDKRGWGDKGGIRRASGGA